MRRYRITLMSIALCLSFLFTGLAAGCQSVTENDVSKEQLIEIAEPDGNVIGQITDTKAILRYFNEQDISNWEEVASIPKEAETKFIYTTYAKILENVFLQEGKPPISVGQEILYQDSKGFYIENKILYDSSVQDMYYKLSDKAGKYMLELSGLSEISDKIVDKSEIFAAWGIEDFNFEEYKEIESADQNDDMKDIDEDEYYDLDYSAYTMRDIGEFSAEELAEVSKEQKVEISFSEDNIYTITSLEEIADFYNNIYMNKWKEVKSIPVSKEEICEIGRYQLKRRSPHKTLALAERIYLYKSGGEYYILSSIPDISDNEGMTMELMYQIPKESGKYIEGLK